MLVFTIPSLVVCLSETIFSVTALQVLTESFPDKIQQCTAKQIKVHQCFIYSVIYLWKCLFVDSVSMYFFLIRRYKYIYIYRYLVLNSKPSFLDLITLAQQLSSQKGVIMEVSRGQYFCIHRQFCKKNSSDSGPH